MSLNLFYSDIFELPLPDKHRFPMSKYRLLRERLINKQEQFSYRLMVPPAASDEQLLLVHSAEYVHKVKQGLLSPLEIRRIGFPWSPKMVERSRRSTGATIAAAQAALQSGFGVNLAGGTHHSFADAGQGYCVFNDVCVAAKVLQKSGKIETALVVDCDVHQGNGTAEICKSDDQMFAFSIHCDKNYPFRKSNGDFDLALPEGTGDEEYLEKLELSLMQIEIAFQPDLVFYLAGADPYENDRLGLFQLTKDGLAQRDRIVLNFYFERGIPVVVAMAGGYAPNVEEIVDIHEQTVQITNSIFDRCTGNAST